jgi:Peptidase family M23
MPNLIGLHDRESVAIAAADSWALDTIALSENPPPTTYRSDLHWICRINHGYGSTGTLPVPDQYNWFAQRAAQYVSGSQNCHRWQIGNECNLRREWPDDQPIYPWHYSACFKLCRNAIHALSGHEHDEVLIAGSGPWNAELAYMSNPHGDWIQYFAECIDLCDGALDGFAIHAYTHGYDPALVTSTARMDSPFHNRYYNFLTYRDYCAAIPDSLRHLPVYITEANGDGPWQAVGLMPAMLQEIHEWNLDGRPLGAPSIHCVTFYRYPRYDHFFIEGRGDVIAEYQAAAARGYESPAVGSPPRPEGPRPEPPQPQPEPDGDYLVEWDPRLDQRGTQLGVVASNAPTEWHVRVGRWYDKAQAQGRINVFVSVLDEQGDLLPNVPVSFVNGGKETKLTEIKHDPWLGHDYSLDFAMYNTAPSYSLQIADEEPSDLLSGMGLGDLENPHHTIHTSYEFIFQRMPRKAEPEPTPPHTEYVLPVLGANLRDEPSTATGEMLHTVPFREAVSVYGRTSGDDGYDWDAVRYQAYDGFIRSDLLSRAQPAPEPEPIVPPRPEGPRPSGGLVHPLPGARITTHWGEAAPEYSPGMWGHSGVDFGGKAKGTTIACCAAGVVIYNAFDRDGYGHFVMVRHDAIHKETLYAHLDEPGAPVGTVLGVGQTLGKVGSSGNSTGPHCHFEVRQLNPDGSYQDGCPMPHGRLDPETFFALHNLKL